jgi:hypothetical protein
VGSRTPCDGYGFHLHVLGFHHAAGFRHLGVSPSVINDRWWPKEERGGLGGFSMVVAVHTPFCRIYTLNNIVYLRARTSLKCRPRLPLGRSRTHLISALEKCILDSLEKAAGQTSDRLRNIFGACSLRASEV